MDYLILLLLLTIDSISTQPQPQSQSNSNSTNVFECNVEGEEKKFINAWSVCHNGRYVQSACVADDGSKVDIGLTVRQRNFVFECVQTSSSSDGSLSLKPVACVRQKDKPENAIVVEPGQRIKDPPFEYECTKILSGDPNANTIALQAVACTNEKEEIPDGGTVILGEFTYNCTRHSGSLTNTNREVFLQAKGCMYQGKEYPLNTQAIIGNFAYRCRSTNGWPTAALEFAIVGCAYEGRRYDPDEKFYTSVKNNGSQTRYISQCRYDNNTWSIQPIGCVQETNPPKEHMIGDTWIDNGGPGDARLKYVVVCRGDVRGLTQTGIQCVYQPNLNDASTAATLDGGCMRRFSNPNVLIKCEKGDEKQGVSIELINKLFLNKEEKDALAAGFRNC